MLVQPLLNFQVHSRMCKTVCCRIVPCTVARVQLSSGSVMVSCLTMKLKSSLKAGTIYPWTKLSTPRILGPACGFTHKNKVPYETVALLVALVHVWALLGRPKAS